MLQSPSSTYTTRWFEGSVVYPIEFSEIFFTSLNIGRRISHNNKIFFEMDLVKFSKYTASISFQRNWEKIVDKEIQKTLNELKDTIVRAQKREKNKFYSFVDNKLTAYDTQFDKVYIFIMQ
jgi:hypothetical protein